MGKDPGEDYLRRPADEVTTAPTPERALEFLRILGNPIRARIFRLMVSGAPMRVADVAQSLRNPANSISYHMRRMAAAGIIHETAPPGAEDRRETWWTVDKQIRTGGNMGAVRALPGGDVALDSFDRTQAEPILDLFSLRRWVDAEGLGAPLDSSTGLVDLTPAQARKFIGAVNDAVLEALADSRANNNPGASGDKSISSALKEADGNVAGAQTRSGDARSKDDQAEDDRVIRYEYRAAIIPVINTDSE